MSEALLHPASSSHALHHGLGLHTSEVIAVDARNHICALLAPHNHKHLVDHERLESFLPRLVTERAQRFVDEHPRMRPLFVLDGPIPPLKRRVVAQRVREKEAAAERVKEALRAGEVRRARELSRQAVRLPKPALDAVVEALRVEGFDVFQAPSEAEAQAAYWAREGAVAYVATRDFDAFLHGAPKVLRRWPHSAGYVRLEDVLREAGAPSWEQLMEAFVLDGETDYAPGHPYVLSLQHAIHILQDTSLETFLEQHPEVEAMPWLDARRAFLEPELLPMPASGIRGW